MPVLSNDLFQPVDADLFGEPLERNDDSSAEVDVSGVFGGGVSVYGTTYSTVYVNNNGNITFGSPMGTFTPGEITNDVAQPIIAPFWADVDTRGGAIDASLWDDYLGNHPGVTGEGTNQVYYHTDSSTGTLIATWDSVGYYNTHTTDNDLGMDGLTDDDLRLNSFQVEIQSLGSDQFRILFRYDDINWVTGDASGGTDGLLGTVARAGYAVGGEVFELAQSGNQGAMLALPTTNGNTGDPGVWEFFINAGLISEELPAVPVYVAPAGPQSQVITGLSGLIIGGDGDDVIVGGGTTDVIFGGGGNDDVDAGSGDDQLFGEAGNDRLLGGGGDDEVDGGDGADRLFGDVGDDQLFGGDGNDRIGGGDGTDLLDGGQGGDILFGGLGADTYRVDSVADRVEEENNDADDSGALDLGSTVDTVMASISYALTNFVEILELAAGAGNLSGTGNELDNRIVGNEGDNSLSGGGGNDELDGGDGLDTAVYGGARANFTVSQSGGTITVADGVGTEGTDTLTHMERLQFADQGLAFDLDGHAGEVAKALGAVFGAAILDNEAAVGLGLDLLDGGTTYEALAEVAISLTGLTDDTAIVSLLLTNVFGTVDAADLAVYVGQLAGGATVGDVAVDIADTAENATNIDLVGLTASGLEFA